MVISTVPVQSLRRGNVFYLEDAQYRLEYLNPCRAYVRPKEQRMILVKGRKFRATATAFSIAPTALVTIRRPR